MKTLLAALILLSITSIGVAAPAPRTIRTINNLPGLPKQSLRNGVSRKFYKSLEVSPVEAWVVVRATLANSRVMGTKVIRSEAGGAYDSMAVMIAEKMEVSGLDRTESQHRLSELMVHLLVYKIADGIMAVSFSHVELAQYAGYRQYGQATIAFLRNGQWTFLENKKK